MKKTKEELLKIYSAYLPYELECEVLKKGMYFPYPNHLSAGRRIIFNLDQMPFKIWCNPTNSDWLDILFRDTKPVLYSMDMLTKEIEHKGERFVPSLEIEKHTITGDTYNWHRVKEENVSILNYEVVAKLLEWHFNVFGLDESEYIKKESLNRSENPNS